jgi:predicted acetyltransferase
MDPVADVGPVRPAPEGIVRQPTPDEFSAFLHLEKRGFAHGEGTLTRETAVDHVERPASELVRERETARALFVAGQPVAGLYLTPFRTFWGRRMVAMEGVGGVTALPEVRRRGYTAALLAGALADMHARRVPLSAITTPFSYGFYRKMGWGYAFRRSRHSSLPRPTTRGR